MDCLLPRVTLWQGLKKTDQQTILDDFNKHKSSTISHPTGAPQVIVRTAAPPVPVAAPSSAIPSTIGTTISPEDVLARAAALGRGAAHQGFKRFLALTEAAKDRKDGPFRKLFNA